MNKNRLKIKEELITWLQAFFFAFIILGLFFLLGFKIKKVDGPSMNPTLETKDRLITANFNYTPKCGDIIVFHNDTQDIDLVKRVIAVGGQEVNIHFETGAVTVDGEVVFDEFSGESIVLSNRGSVNYPVTVPEGHVFVLGDNRTNSTDSRYSQVGMVDIKSIKGRALFRIYPIHKIGSVQ